MHFATGHDEGNELVSALNQVLDDDSFKMKAPATIAARKSADELLIPKAIKVALNACSLESICSECYRAETTVAPVTK